MDPLRDRPTSDQLKNAGGPPEETDVFTALRGSMPIEVSNEQIQRISKAVINKFPSVATSLIAAIVPLVMHEKTKEDSDFFYENISATFLMTGFAVAITCLIRNRLFNVPAFKQYGINPELETPEKRTDWSETKLKALRNWEIGNIIGNVGMAVYQLSLVTQGSYGNAIGMCLGSLLTASYSSTVMPKEEEISQIKSTPVNIMRQVITDAVNKGLLDEEDVSTMMALQGIQNLIIYNSLNQLSTDKFINIFSKLINSNPQAGPVVSRDVIIDLQSRVRSLSNKDKLILEKKLAINESEDEPDDEKGVQELFKEIANIAHHSWYKYKKEITKSIQSEDQEATLQFYDRFLEFLAGK